MATHEECKVAAPDMKNEPVSTNSHPSGDLPSSEALPDSNVAKSEVLQNNDLPNDETHSNKEQPSSDNQPTSEEANAGTLPDTEGPPGNQPAKPESMPNNRSDNTEVPLNKQLSNSEALHDNQLVSSEAYLEKQLVPETLPGNQLVNSELHTSSGVVMSETQLSTEVVISVTQHSNYVVMSETQPSNEVVRSETQLINDLVMSETQPSNEVLTSDVAVSETQPTREVAVSEAQPSNEAVRSEALPQNHLVHSTARPNNQFSTSEGFPDNQFTNHHKLHENQLRVSEPLPNNQLIEALSNNGIADSQVLSHDQLGNFQMLSDFKNEAHSSQLVNSQTNNELATIPSYEIVNASTPLNDGERTPETQPYRRRKRKSIVWEHFTIETVSPGCRRACCKQCKQSFAYSTGSKVAGTSHLKRHIAKGACAALLRGQGQNTPYTPRSRGTGAGRVSDAPKRRYRSPSTPYVTFDQDLCRQEIVRMIIMHDYPLHVVEHPGFVAFVQNLEPRFNMVTFNTVQGDCVATYLMEKQSLTKYIDGLPGRVCLTLDMWGSCQSVGYVFITGHFVDNDWKLQKRILNVVMEPYPDSDSALSHAVAACLADWNLEGRLFSITTKQAASDNARENLRSLFSVKNPFIFNGQLLVVNCIAHTLSSVAKDLLDSARDIVKKVRDSVKYVKTSESHEEKFMELKQQLQVPSERTLFIDDQSQWNTTFQMLVAASELKEVFSCLDTSDPDYKGAPSMQDWKLVEILCTYLKLLFDAANILTTTSHPTAITFFHEVWKLQLDLARAGMSEDPFTNNLNKIMQEKIDRYWRDCNLVLAIAVVMDPRFKMKLVEFSFTKIYGDDAQAHIKVVEDGINELFHEYVALPLPLTPTYAEDGSGGSNMKMEESPGGTLMSYNGFTDFDVYIMETNSQQMKSELDQYLDESLLPRVPDFDILGWWKQNRLKYPTLSKMARDILSVPISTVPSDSLFDTKNKEMDQYRCSLLPETVEALVCAKDWMQ